MSSIDCVVEVLSDKAEVLVVTSVDRETFEGVPNIITDVDQFSSRGMIFIAVSGKNRESKD